MLARARWLPEVRDNEARRSDAVRSATSRGERRARRQDAAHRRLRQIGGRLAWLAMAFDMRVIGIRRVRGGATVVGDGLVDIQAVKSTENVTFLSNGSGGLEIIDTQANTSAFARKVSGFGGVSSTNTSQFMDLVSVTFVSGLMSDSYTAITSRSGVLTVTSGRTAVAKINLVGSGYTTSGFQLNSAADGSTIITDPEVVSGGGVETSSAPVLAPQSSIDFLQDRLRRPHDAWLFGEQQRHQRDADGHGWPHIAKIALLGNYMAASFVTAADGHGGTLITEAAQTANQLLPLTTPHTG